MSPAPTDALGFLALGLLGSVGHCVGMCAPFILFVSRRYASPDAAHGVILRQQLTYALGRITTYALLGGLAGLAGSGVEFTAAAAGLRRGAALIAGATLVLYAAGALSGLARRAGAGHGLTAQLFARLAAKPPKSPLLFGLLLGLLPCGLLYAALIAAAAQHSAWRGALALAAFGLGTVPALLALAGADTQFARPRPWLNRAALALVGLMGAGLVWRAWL